MAKSKPEVLQNLITIVADTFSTHPALISGDTSALDVDGWDSVSHVRLIVAVENHFCIQFDILEVLKARNLDDLANLIVLQ